ncbi:hypothetical protein TSAR_012920 [Trichomalopsis sarcophagae]|uniref:Uncharacterized protein n=1 Tax=Trichomalopsis sarcophagae TaxID=543379 RepID=A0A232F821_9HYME|nr:hypothetical protein TSAR_012920 [Trichomalopsis sarcophagae]
MDALELQAALVKLDPATTVTPIGSNVNLQQINFNANMDETDLTLQNAHNNAQQQQVTGSNNSVGRKASGNQNNPANQPLKCSIAEVRADKHHSKHLAKEKRYHHFHHHHHHTLHHKNRAVSWNNRL